MWITHSFIYCCLKGRETGDLPFTDSFPKCLGTETQICISHTGGRGSNSWGPTCRLPGFPFWGQSLAWAQEPRHFRMESSCPLVLCPLWQMPPLTCPFFTENHDSAKAALLLPKQTRTWALPTSPRLRFCHLDIHCHPLESCIFSHIVPVTPTKHTAICILVVVLPLSHILKILLLFIIYFLNLYYLPMTYILFLSRFYNMLITATIKQKTLVWADFQTAQYLA